MKNAAFTLLLLFTVAILTACEKEGPSVPPTIEELHRIQGPNGYWIALFETTSTNQLAIEINNNNNGFGTGPRQHFQIQTDSVYAFIIQTKHTIGDFSEPCENEFNFGGDTILRYSNGWLYTTPYHPNRLNVIHQLIQPTN